MGQKTGGGSGEKVSSVQDTAGTLQIQRRCSRATREQQKAPRFYKKINHRSSADNWPQHGSKFQPPNIMPAGFDGGGGMGRRRISLNLIILTELALHADEVGCGYSFLAQFWALHGFSFPHNMLGPDPSCGIEGSHLIECFQTQRSAPSSRFPHGS